MTARLSVSAPQAPDSTHRTTQTPSNTRRANKPLMEKRRRARINQSLALLKTLILDSAKMENTKHSKLEKADILELTVRHLQRQKTLSSTSVDKYRAGFMECAREVTRFLDTPELQCGAGVGNKPIGIDPTVRQRLMRHLESCAAEISLDFSTAKVGPLKPIDTETEKRLEQLEELLVGPEEADKPDSSTVSPGDENNNSRRKTKVEKVDSSTNSPSTSNNPVSLVQVIPSRLPDGQVVFLLPSHYVQLTQGMEENKSPQEVPIDFSLRKDEGTDDKEEEVWRPW